MFPGRTTLFLFVHSCVTFLCAWAASPFFTFRRTGLLCTVVWLKWAVCPARATHHSCRCDGVCVVDGKREKFYFEFWKWRQVAAMFQCRVYTRCTRGCHIEMLDWLNLEGCQPNVVECVPQFRGQFWLQQSAASPVGWSSLWLSPRSVCFWDGFVRAACPDLWAACPDPRFLLFTTLEDCIDDRKEVWKVQGLMFSWWCILLIYGVAFSQVMLSRSYGCALLEHWYTDYGVVRRLTFPEEIHYVITRIGEVLRCKKIMNWLGTGTVPYGIGLHGLWKSLGMNYFLTEVCMVAERIEDPQDSPCTAIFHFLLFSSLAFVLLRSWPVSLLPSFCIVSACHLLLHVFTILQFTFFSAFSPGGLPAHT